MYESVFYSDSLNHELETEGINSSLDNGNRPWHNHTRMQSDDMVRSITRYMSTHLLALLSPSSISRRKSGLLTRAPGAAIPCHFEKAKNQILKHWTRGAAADFMSIDFASFLDSLISCPSIKP